MEFGVLGDCGWELIDRRIGDVEGKVKVFAQR